MAWVWDQSAGQLLRGGKVIANGYSGRLDGKNDPDDQHRQGIGPIPRGRWKIGKPVNSERTGRYAIPLSPLPGTDALGRSAFQIHGDSVKNPGMASSGCIILPMPIRQKIWESGDHVIEVVE